MKRKILLILQNIRILSPLLSIPIGTVLFFATICCAICAVLGKTEKIFGLSLIATFVIGLVVYVFWPLISFDEDEYKTGV